DDSSIPLIPLGLMMTPRANGPPDFLGYHFRIESPLPVQNYQPVQACISNWVLVRPPAGSDLDAARSRFDENLAGFNSGVQYPYERITEFSNSYAGSGVEAEPTVVTVISHHDNGAIWYDPQDLMLYSGLQRHFDKPSVAILDNCGSSGSGGVAGFV